METSKLFKILKTIGHVKSSRWSTIEALVECIQFKEATVIKKSWQEKFMQSNLKHYPLDLSKIGTWSTYEDCIDLHFTTDKDDFHCYVKIYDGDSFGGYRTNLRFTAELLLPLSFLNKIENSIHYGLTSHLEDLYDKHLEKQKLDWINKKRISILSK